MNSSYVNKINSSEFYLKANGFIRLDIKIH